MDRCSLRFHTPKFFCSCQRTERPSHEPSVLSTGIIFPREGFIKTHNTPIEKSRARVKHTPVGTLKVQPVILYYQRIKYSLYSSITMEGASSPQSNKESVMSPRLLAQDAVRVYEYRMDVFESHRNNITQSFAPIVLSLTHFILDEEKRPSWTDYLQDAMDSQYSPTQKKQSSGSLVSLGKAILSPLDRRTIARMDAFLNGIIWSVPTSSGTALPRRKNENVDLQNKSQLTGSVSLMDGLSGFKAVTPLQSGSLFRKISSGGASIASADSIEQPQVRTLDLTIRLELYLRTLLRVEKSAQHQHCVLAAEPPRAIRARVEAIVTAFSETVGTVRQQGPVLTRLVTCMTMELLAVSCLSQSCKGAIRRLVVDYEHQTSFASLAFLSSPDDAADQKLAPLLLRYFDTLKENWETAVRDCEIEDMLVSVLDPQMRHFFKTVEFSSIGHLLETCASYRPFLQKIDLPPTYKLSPVCFSQLQDEQDIRQALRDLQRERITINGNLLPTASSRSELVRLLSQTLNSTSLTPDGGTKKPGRRSRRKRSSRKTVPKSSDDDSDVSSLSANESDGGSFVSLSSMSSKQGQSRKFDISTIDMLTKRLLLAGSRSDFGGSAFFIVRVLFGGKDVQVLPSQQPRGLGGSTSASIELWLHLASLTIQSHMSFDVYPLLQDNRDDPYAIMDQMEPLIQLHTTTTEIIGLQEVRAADVMASSGIDDNVAKSTHHTEHNGSYVLQERPTERQGWRTLSVRPALYEKLQVWNVL